MTLVTMNAAAIGGAIDLPYTGRVVVPANGTITVDSRDVLALMIEGATYMSTIQRSAYFPAARAATAGRLVASTALTNGTLAIANQVDVPRQGQVIMGNGAGPPITAGNLALTYIANDGAPQVDNFSAVLASSGAATSATSKGIQVINSAIVTGIVGGSSPFVYISDTNSLSFVVEPGFQGFALVREAVDATTEISGQTVASSAASVTPSTAPNGTHNFSMSATYQYPGNV